MYRIVKTNSQTDFEAIQQVYYQTWKYSYIGLVPQPFLDNLDPEIWQPQKRLHNTLIAVNSTKKIIGVCTFGPARRPKYTGLGEIYSLYVLPEFQHQEIGQKLFKSALEVLQKNYQELYLVVLRNNLTACAFYEMFGFEPSDDLLAEQTAYGILHEIVYLKKASN